MLQSAYQDMASGKSDAALDKANHLLNLNSQSRNGHMLRAFIYASQKQWAKADIDYAIILQSDPTSAIVKYDRAELQFMQKNYAEARSGFVEIESDKDLGDFAGYKVFLCDLLGSHEQLAEKELEAIDQTGGTPSYYFENAVWDLFHDKTNDGKGWIRSAVHIYGDAPGKLANYVSSLKSLGYMPVATSQVQ